MKMIPKAAMILGLAGVMGLMTPVFSAAQMRGSMSDTWAHMGEPGPNGQCWIPNDRPYMEHGTGYWGACAKSAAPSAAHMNGYNARAQAMKPQRTQNR